MREIVLRGGEWTRPEVADEDTTNADGEARTFRFLQTSQALQTLALTTLAGL